MSEFTVSAEQFEAGPRPMPSSDWDIIHDPLLAELGIPETLLQASLRQEQMIRQTDELHNVNQLFSDVSNEALQQARKEVLDAGNDPELLLKLFRTNPSRKSLLLAGVELHGDRDGMAALYELSDIFIKAFGIRDSGIKTIRDIPRDIYLNSDPSTSAVFALQVTCNRVAPAVLEDIYGNAFGMGLKFYGQVNLHEFKDEDFPIRDAMLAEDKNIWRPSNGVKKYLRTALDNKEDTIFPGGGRLYVYRKAPGGEKLSYTEN